MASYRISLVLLLLFFLSRLHTSKAQSVQLLYPSTGGDGSSTLSLNYGEELPIQWSCTWPMFTLQVWQGPDSEGTKAFRELQTNVTNTTMSSYSWKAETLAGMSGDVDMHIRILNPEDKNCPTCVDRSVAFSIKGNKPTNSTTLPSASATASQASEASSNLKLGLGVGLGLGIPLAAALASLLTFCCLRRRYQAPHIQTAEAYEAPLAEWKQPPPTTSSSPERRVDAQTAGVNGTQEYYAQTQQPKVPNMAAGGQEAVELQPELMRVEAPRDTERMELDGNAVQPSNLGRKFSWQR